MNSKKVNQNESLGHKVRRLRYLLRYDDRSIALSALDRFFIKRRKLMKNLLNRLTRFMIIMLLLVDRTPFFNVYAEDPIPVPATIVVQQDKFEVYSSVVQTNNWILEKTVNDSIIDLNLLESQEVLYTINATRKIRYLFTVEFGVTYTNTKGTQATFNSYALVTDPSGNHDVFYNGIIERDIVLDPGEVYSKVYLLDLNISAEAYDKVSPFKIDVDLRETLNVGTFDLKGNQPSIKLKNIVFDINDATLTVTDSLVNSVNKVFTDTGSFSYNYTHLAGQIGTRTVTNVATGVTSGDADGLNKITLTDFVDVAINTLNRPPVAFGQTIPDFNEDPSSPVSITLTGSDPDGHSLTYMILSYPVHGELGGSSSDATYIPDPDYHGTDEFTFRVDDGFGGVSDTATVKLNVLPVNDAPFADDETFVIDEDLPFTFTEADLLNGDIDVDGDILAIISNTNPLIGTLSFNPTTRVFTYTPALNNLEEASFKYIVSDGHGGTGVGLVTFTITPTNDAPEADNKTYSIDEDTTITLTPLDFDNLVTDPENDAVKVITLTPNFGNDKGSLVYVRDRKSVV